MKTIAFKLLLGSLAIQNVSTAEAEVTEICKDSPGVYPCVVEFEESIKTQRESLTENDRKVVLINTGDDVNEGHE